MCRVTIERDSLVAIRKSVINSHSKLDRSTWKKLCELNIARKTIRGCRAGRNKQRSIAVQITDRPRISRSEINTSAAKCALVNHKRSNPNLIRIKSQSNGPKHQNCKIATWNARSMTKKTAAISDFVISNDIDILAITESWLTGDHRDSHKIADLKNTLTDYDFIDSPRVGRRGGGVAVILRKGFSVTRHSVTSF